jgi:hypothetical protein
MSLSLPNGMTTMRLTLTRIGFYLLYRSRKGEQLFFCLTRWITRLQTQYETYMLERYHSNPRDFDAG